jgi:shikimate dehydrogenase
VSGPDRYAVFGHPVGHSLSPRIHGAFAAQLGETIGYAAIEAPRDGFALALRAFFAAGGHGANVTLPFKAEAFALADRRDPLAEQAGAANTLRREADGALGAFNTDGIGLVRDLVRLGLAPEGRRVLLVGAGGAAAGVLGPLLAAGPASVHVVNRTPERAAALVARFAIASGLTSGGVDTAAGIYDLVVNATAAGHQRDTPGLPDVRFAVRGGAYDLSYGPAAMPFLGWARGAGAGRVADGLGMLVEQAAEAYFIWRGRRPDTAPVLAALRTTC